jgi:hypothetical protein
LWRTEPTFLNFTILTAAITINIVSIVTLLRSKIQSISAFFETLISFGTVYSTFPACLNFTSRAATISIYQIAIVACMFPKIEAVPTYLLASIWHEWRTSRANKACLKRAGTRATIPIDNVPIITGIVASVPSIPANLKAYIRLSRTTSPTGHPWFHPAL